jgi:hypothetical protein
VWPWPAKTFSGDEAGDSQPHGAQLLDPSQFWRYSRGCVLSCGYHLVRLPPSVDAQVQSSVIGSVDARFLTIFSKRQSIKQSTVKFTTAVSGFVGQQWAHSSIYDDGGIVGNGLHQQ